MTIKMLVPMLIDYVTIIDDNGSVWHGHYSNIPYYYYKYNIIRIKAITRNLEHGIEIYIERNFEHDNL